MPENSKSPTDIAVVILTFNEAKNLPQALASVRGWGREIFVVDSNSSDATVEIAMQEGCTVLRNAFVAYGQQRNFALDHAGIESEWILFLDADEWVTPELKAEISSMIRAKPKENGFYLKWRMIWMG